MPNSSARAGRSVSAVLRLVMSVRYKNFCRGKALVPHFGSTILHYGVPAESIFGGVSSRGRKARMGLPAKCTFCGVPGRRGYNTPMSQEHGICKFCILLQNDTFCRRIGKSAELSAPFPLPEHVGKFPTKVNACSPRAAHTCTVPSEHTTSTTLLSLHQLSLLIAFHSSIVPSNVTDVSLQPENT